ncbi:MAG: DEAD/DEAH box helicase family protein, partial [Prevotellaceae bacterium]|nr:DEAD/DEAH box helicase family protein [Prevotellaceae bacterium]
MELKLESGLEHQMLAVDAISEVFKMVEIDQEVANSSNPIVNLDSNQFATNIRAIQKKETQNVAEKFRAAQPVDNTLCLDIKMETGTGKTYVYTHTIFELHKLYGINKFIIAVPSIPIKAGTGAFLNETYARAHFKNTLGYDAEISVGVLEAEKKQKKGRKYFPSVVRNFVEGSRQNTNKIYVMLVNRSLLTNGKMLSRSDYDVTVADYARPFDALRATHPFVIIDEPHTFSRDQKAYKVIMQELEPQCIIRFGATFPMATVGKGKKKMVVRDYEHLLYDL